MIPALQLANILVSSLLFTQMQLPAHIPTGQQYLIFNYIHTFG